ncbi:hypothetical protein ACFS5N_16340 [Mucilaginibacter ximonensis]|uniref:Uncharacterized protein n=1 Tax=Mucilaginibacter ximonensis TaxID=538021 RepID=A0ABW5YF97_9SPHI
MPFIFVSMAYNRSNQQKRVNYVMNKYNELKESDVPDTRILKRLAEYNIFISYRTLMNYKGMKPSEYKQPTLFPV